MVDNDIYDNKGRYENFKKSLQSYLDEPTGKRKYKIKNPENLKYFAKLMNRFEADDKSYIRRMRLLRTFMMVCHAISDDLKNVDRDVVDQAVIFANKQNKSSKSKQDFTKDLKHIWKIILPERDERGRVDDTIVPYVVRHLNSKIDKSREKMRKDRMTIEEYEKLLAGFGDDTRMQALLSLMLESLGRPQEILGRNIQDVEIHENYAKIYITEHGKEGIGFLRSIDSFYYITKWLNQHPLRDNPQAPFFITLGTRNKYQRLNPSAANKLIRAKTRSLGIAKPLTLYSFKRNGVTLCRLRGDTDVDIQHRARWTSTRQLKTYDMSTQDDAFKIELIKRGILQPDEKHSQIRSLQKRCWFCNSQNGLSNTICSTCSRPLDRKTIENREGEKEKQHQDLKTELESLKMEQARTKDIHEFMLEMIKRLDKKDKLNNLIETVKMTGLTQTIEKIK